MISVTDVDLNLNQLVVVERSVEFQLDIVSDAIGANGYNRIELVRNRAILLQ